MDRVAQETLQVPRPLEARDYYQRVQYFGNHERVSIHSSGPSNLRVQDHPDFGNYVRRVPPPAAFSSSGGHASNYQSKGQGKDMGKGKDKCKGKSAHNYRLYRPAPYHWIRG